MYENMRQTMVKITQQKKDMSIQQISPRCHVSAKRLANFLLCFCLENISVDQRWALALGCTSISCS